jgi:hypothetical protein
MLIDDFILMASLDPALFPQKDKAPFRKLALGPLVSVNFRRGLHCMSQGAGRQAKSRENVLEDDQSLLRRWTVTDSPEERQRHLIISGGKGDDDSVLKQLFL